MLKTKLDFDLFSQIMSIHCPWARVYKPDTFNGFIAEGERGKIIYKPETNECIVIHNQSLHQVGAGHDIDEAIEELKELDRRGSI